MNNSSSSQNMMMVNNKKPTPYLGQTLTKMPSQAQVSSPQNNSRDSQKALIPAKGGM